MTAKKNKSELSKSLSSSKQTSSSSSTRQNHREESVKRAKYSEEAQRTYEAESSERIVMDSMGNVLERTINESQPIYTSTSSSNKTNNMANLETLDILAAELMDSANSINDVKPTSSSTPFVQKNVEYEHKEEKLPNGGYMKVDSKKGHEEAYQSTPNSSAYAASYFMESNASYDNYDSQRARQTNANEQRITNDNVDYQRISDHTHEFQETTSEDVRNRSFKPGDSTWDGSFTYENNQQHQTSTPKNRRKAEKRAGTIDVREVTEDSGINEMDYMTSSNYSMEHSSSEKEMNSVKRSLYNDFNDSQEQQTFEESRMYRDTRSTPERIIPIQQTNGNHNDTTSNTTIHRETTSRRSVSPDSRYRTADYNATSGWDGTFVRESSRNYENSRRSIYDNVDEISESTSIYHDVSNGSRISPERIIPIHQSNEESHIYQDISRASSRSRNTPERIIPVQTSNDGHHVHRTTEEFIAMESNRWPNSYTEDRLMSEQRFDRSSMERDNVQTTTTTTTVITTEEDESLLREIIPPNARNVKLEETMNVEEFVQTTTTVMPPPPPQVITVQEIEVVLEPTDGSEKTVTTTLLYDIQDSRYQSEHLH